jgi:hypothetical protein
VADSTTVTDTSAATLEECFLRAEEANARGEAADLEAARDSGRWYNAAKKQAKKERKPWLPELKARCDAKGISTRTAHSNMRLDEKWKEVLEFAARCKLQEPTSKRAFFELLAKKNEPPGDNDPADNDPAGDSSPAPEELIEEHWSQVVDLLPQVSGEAQERFAQAAVEKLFQLTGLHLVKSATNPQDYVFMKMGEAYTQGSTGHE